VTGTRVGHEWRGARLEDDVPPVDTELVRLAAEDLPRERPRNRTLVGRHPAAVGPNGLHLDRELLEVCLAEQPERLAVRDDRSAVLVDCNQRRRDVLDHRLEEEAVLISAGHPLEDAIGDGPRDLAHRAFACERIAGHALNLARSGSA
jgi:hypothetical protein